MIFQKRFTSPTDFLFFLQKDSYRMHSSANAIVMKLKDLHRDAGLEKKISHHNHIFEFLDSCLTDSTSQHGQRITNRRYNEPHNSDQ